MPRGRQIDREVLEAALVGLQYQQAKIDAKMAELRKLVAAHGRRKTAIPAREAKPRRRPLSVAARRRIALAQKRRWAIWKKQKAAQAR